MNNDPTFMSLCLGAYDPAMENQAFPYVTFGNHTESQWLTFGNLGRNVLMQLHVWSQTFGYKQCYDILNAMNALFDAKQLALTHFTNVITLYEGSSKLQAQDGITRHVVARYRMYNIANS